MSGSLVSRLPNTFEPINCSTNPLVQTLLKQLNGLLNQASDPELVERFVRTKTSQLQYVGVSTRRIRQILPSIDHVRNWPMKDQLKAWDAIVHSTSTFEHISCALEFFRPPNCPITLLHREMFLSWGKLIDNWDHSDSLSRILSYLLEDEFVHQNMFPGPIYSTLDNWSKANGPWLQRLSIVSLKHYGGDDCIFLPPPTMLSVVNALLDSRFASVQAAIGWVLRDLAKVHPKEVEDFIASNSERLSSLALRKYDR
ncbi:MAG: DNA alkylation repair protein [Bdellovibrionales bacterium]|nr:DNA alkylation repair protein [Bdellovibrionales bacterium]